MISGVVGGCLRLAFYVQRTYVDHLRTNETPGKPKTSLASWYVLIVHSLVERIADNMTGFLPGTGHVPDRSVAPPTSLPHESYTKRSKYLIIPEDVTQLQGVTQFQMVTQFRNLANSATH